MYVYRVGMLCTLCLYVVCGIYVVLCVYLLHVGMHVVCGMYVLWLYLVA